MALITTTAQKRAHYEVSKGLIATSHKMPLLTLGFGTFICVAIIVARVIYTGQPWYAFLLWNLFLAWVPLTLALAAYWVQESDVAVFGMGLMWLLFFPNALYMVTDLIYINQSRYELVWFDLLMLVYFALTGLFLGFASLQIMQSLWAKFGSVKGSWRFVMVSLSLGAFGVAIGRLLRWNSWDIFSHPYQVAASVLGAILRPWRHWDIWMMTVLLTAVFLFVYLAITQLPKLTSLSEE